MIYIFTPTYNRAYMLNKLYESLCNQSNKDFTWILIDDGSTDNTKELVDKFILEDKINIIYKYQENGGKHKAYNLALDTMEEDKYHICVDSDDSLNLDAVSKFYYDLKNIKKNSFSTTGVIYPKNIVGRKTSNKVKDIFLKTQNSGLDTLDLFYKYNIKIETAILINNEYLKDFRFKIIKDEKFLSEFTMYYHISKYGKFYPIYDEVYYFEYLEDGLTTNLFSLWLKNINSTIYDFEKRYEYICKNVKGIKKIKYILFNKLNTQALLLSKNSFLDILKREKIFLKFLLPFSYIFKNIRFRKGINK